MKDNLHLKINLKALALIGLWPIETKSKIIKWLHKIYTLLIVCYFVAFVTSEYIQVIVTINQDFFVVVDTLSVSLLYSITIMKIKICRSEKVQKFIKQIFETEKVILEDDDEEMKAIYQTHVRWNQKLSKVFLTITTSTMLSFFVNPMIVEIMGNQIGNHTEMIDNKTVNAERALPFSSWFPFDKNRHYVLSFSLQIIAGVVGSFFTCNSDILYWSLMIFGIGQLKILQYKFKNLYKSGNEVSKSCKMSIEAGVNCVLRKSIMLHQVIITYMDELDTCLTFLMFMDFIICSIQIGAIGFQIIVSGFGLTQAFAMQYLLAMLVQMFFFYWHANEIILESLKISDAIWAGEFYQCTSSVQRSLTFVTMRSQKPLTLKVGSFYVMSTATAISICRAAYSYVALMRQILNK